MAQIKMDDTERDVRCAATPLYYYPDRAGCMCRVYGRWVRDCFDCAFKIPANTQMDEQEPSVCGGA